ncbi:AIPR family protein [Streptomyces guryensis]|uniref:AIPR family protein n=1 Tax=Streptomyces guryensis TaxID=2886947 RepID=A0A9Q3ZFF6_9ACTN|nr:AIPR family protein [Streptomyces guryensis]MCD9880560.1 AIPR family protein [Streptomyces guryensis]
MSDLDGRPEEIRRQAFLSRGLAALAVHELTGLDLEHSSLCVIDGFDDEGIDAVAVDTDGEFPRLWLVQAKWSSKGNATFDSDAFRALKDGLDKLVKGQYERFNGKLQAMVPDINRALDNARSQIILVPALAGEQKISPRVRLEFLDLQKEHGEENMKIQPLLLSDFVASIRSGLEDPQINLKVRMADPRYEGEPYLAYYGNVSADQIAQWYADERHRLFKRNVRYPLGLTRVNSDLVETLLRNPENFWYFHNGITVLCDRLDAGVRGHLELIGASVVNGAQTVASIHEAYSQDPAAVARARIGVRIISLEDAPRNFGQQVTMSTNTQNGMAPQDFRAQDKIQERLRLDFDVTVGKRYVTKRGEAAPARDEGCSMLEAAVAMACCNDDAEMSFRVESGERRLWNDDTYFPIFRNASATKVWRAVQVVREIKRVLDETQSDREGKGAQLGERGEFLISHLVFQVNEGWATRVDEDWDEIVDKIPACVDSSLRWVMRHIDSGVAGTVQIGGIFRLAERYTQIAALALQGLKSGRMAPDLADEYRAAEREKRARQANAVHVIVDAGILEEGTLLEFRPVTGPERKALAAWVAADSRRSRATWVESKNSPLLWQWDGKRYSPSKLVQVMFENAQKSGPKAVQGTRRWFVPEQGSLVDIADRIRGELGDQE